LKLNREEALRWFDQAQHDVEVAKTNFASGFYSDACYMSEQAAQKGLKAFIIYHGKRYLWEHSVQELAKISSHYDKEFEWVVEAGMILDRYYIPTRYPDALASPAVPYKFYIAKDASEVISLAEKIIPMV
jgi:HEPN domain-containing protein